MDASDRSIRSRLGFGASLAEIEGRNVNTIASVSDRYLRFLQKQLSLRGEDQIEQTYKDKLKSLKIEQRIHRRLSPACPIEIGIIVNDNKLRDFFVDMDCLRKNIDELMPLSEEDDSGRCSVVKNEDKFYFKPLVELQLDRVLRCVYGESQLFEMMVNFWHDLFFINPRSPGVEFPVAGALIGHFSETAIRTHCFGSFKDMLIACVTHPAMLVYYGVAGMQYDKNDPENDKINENLGREVLELFTLGTVDSKGEPNYSDADVVQAAKALSGWVVGTEKAAGGVGWIGKGPSHDLKTWYIADYHRDATGTFSGGHESPLRIDPIPTDDNGLTNKQGLQLLGILANHPLTIERIVRRMVQRFIEIDHRNQDLVDRMICAGKCAWKNNEDKADQIRCVLEAILSVDGVATAPPTRARTAFEYLVAVIRATGIDPFHNLGLFEYFDQSDALPLTWPSVKGPPDNNQYWNKTYGVAVRRRLAFFMATGYWQYHNEPIPEDPETRHYFSDKKIPIGTTLKAAIKLWAERLSPEIAECDGALERLNAYASNLLPGTNLSTLPYDPTDDEQNKAVAHIVMALMQTSNWHMR